MQAREHEQLVQNKKKRPLLYFNPFKRYRQQQAGAEHPLLGAMPLYSRARHPKAPPVNFSLCLSFNLSLSLSG